MVAKVNFPAEMTVITLSLACLLIGLSKIPLKTGVNEDANRGVEGIAFAFGLN